MVRVNKSENEFNEKKFRDFCNQYLFSFPHEFMIYLKNTMMLNWNPMC